MIENLVSGLGGLVGGAVLNWVIMNKLGGYGKTRQRLAMAHGVIAYAKASLVRLDDLVLAAHAATKDSSIDKGEVKVIVGEAADLAQTLKDRTILTDAMAELEGVPMVPALRSGRELAH